MIDASSLMNLLSVCSRGVRATACFYFLFIESACFGCCVCVLVPEREKGHLPKDVSFFRIHRFAAALTQRTDAIVIRRLPINR